MANNEHVNKVEYFGQTIMDISDTTATTEDVDSGAVFYAANGARSVGTAANVKTVTMNGTTLSPTSGDVNLGTVITPTDIMSGASSSVAGSAGLVPAPSAGDDTKFLCGDGVWQSPSFDKTTFQDTTFSIATSDWTAITGGYKYNLSIAGVNSSTQFWILLDESYYEYCDKSGVTLTPTSNAINFVVTSKPSGTITGTIRIAKVVESSAGNGTDYYTTAQADALLAAKANTSHEHAAGDITSGTLALARGGTGMGATSSTTTTSSIAEAESGCSITTAQYAYWGKVAMVRLVVKKTTAVASGTTSLCTLVSGKRPAYNASATCLTSGLIASITSAGRVQVTGSISANASMTILSTFVLA